MSSSANGLIDIDHLMVSVADSQQAGEAFARMGFTVTPKSALPGLSNRLVCFPAQRDGACNYIELMALEAAASAPPPMPALLDPPGRPVSMVLGSSDAETTQAAMQGLGIDVAPPLHLERDWLLPSGETISPAFAVLIPPPGFAPLYWNVCQHKTPQHYLRDDFVSHANGARAFTAVIATALEPQATADALAAQWGAGAAAPKAGDGSVRLALGSVELRLYAPAGFAAAFPGLAGSVAEEGFAGLAIAVDNPQAMAERLSANGFAPAPCPGGLVLPPSDTAGGLLLFEPPTA